MTSAPVLMYHGVDAGPAPRFARFAVSPDGLRRQLGWLAAAGLHGVSLQELLDTVDRGEPTEGLVGLTFDDAYADFADNAVPALLDAGFTATVYVPTALAGGRASWLKRLGADDRPIMSWATLRDVLAVGMEVASHGAHHVALDSLSPRELHAEVTLSAAQLVHELGVALTTFCYPFGYSSAAVRDEVRRAGFTGACSIRYRRWDVAGDRYRIDRLFGRERDTPESFLRALDPRPQQRLAPMLKQPAEPAWRVVRRYGRQMQALSR